MTSPKILLRPYQFEAVDAVRKSLTRMSKPLIVAPTASGKSIIIAQICQLAFSRGGRVLSLCYQGEILEQNERALKSINPDVSTGIYCAGQGRKDTHQSIIFASRQSLARNPTACGGFSIVIVDEAHMVNPKSGTEYMKIFDAIKPKYVIGFTGTPWRLSGGNIWGKKGFFDEICYNIPLDMLVEQGYLSNYSYAETQKIIKTTDISVSASTKDFKTQELERVSSTPSVVDDCITSWESLSYGRRCSIFFCCSVAHSKLVANCLQQRGYAVGRIDATMKRRDREQFMIDAKDGKYQCLITVGVLTTGVDLPVVDCAVMLRATMSASLYVQCIGRSLRLCPGKTDALIIDFTDNSDRFGGINAPLIKQNSFPEILPGDPLSGKDSERFKKPCPVCLTPCFIATKVCGYCAHIFISHTGTVRGKKSRAKTSGWFTVKRFNYRQGQTKKGEPCIIVTYLLSDGKTIREWLLTGRDGYTGVKARSRRDEISGLSAIGVNKIYIDDITQTFPNVTRIEINEDMDRFA